jgi:uncharacterized protein YgiM (DUF1202 family)
MNHSTPVSRRAFVRKLGAGALATAMVGTALASSVNKAAAQDDVSAAAVGEYRATTSLNLRAQPNTSSQVLAVIPQGGYVIAVGPEQNGFLQVNFGGKVGWAYGQYLTLSDQGTGDIPKSIGWGKTTSSVNLRQGPGTNTSVIRVLSAGASIELFDRVENNFRLVKHNGTLGWVHLDFISQGGGQGGVRTTTSLNLRAQPSMSGQVLLVIPAGATVSATNEYSNGFRKVSYGGKTGWAYNAYLTT